MTDDRVLELALMVGVRPKGQGRPRFDPRSRRAYTPPATREYVNLLRGKAEQEWGAREPLTAPLRAAVTCWFALPKRDKARTHHVQKPDADNLAKAALDALNGVVFADDAQITDLIVAKRWSIEGDAISINIWSYQ